MRITSEHLAVMDKAISALDVNMIKSHRDQLKLDPRVKDLDKRLRWDCMYAANLNSFVCQVLYTYLNDDHIDTALKHVMPTISH